MYKHKKLNAGGIEMLSFPSDTKDKIEKLYGPVILNNFPNYADFWNKFIGVKVSNNGVFLPYGLIYPATISDRDKKRMTGNYREISMSHYSLFCHLAGTHFQLDLLRKTPITRSKISYFRHFECFESCYLHLGIVYNQICHLWSILFEIIGIGRNQVARNLENYLTSRRKKYLWKEFQKLYINSVRLRNNITHFSRGANKIAHGRSYIPELIKENAIWDKQMKYKHWIETSVKIERDLTNWEVLLNKLHGFLIKEFDGYLTRNRINVNY